MSYQFIQLAGAAVLLMIAATTAIVLLVYRVLLPGVMSWSDSTPGHARCRKCHQRIRGCRHRDGVGSTWVHSATGLRYCADGAGIAEHP
jgi:hypothetical protein